MKNFSKNQKIRIKGWLFEEMYDAYMDDRIEDVNRYTVVIEDVFADHPCWGESGAIKILRMLFPSYEKMFHALRVVNEHRQIHTPAEVVSELVNMFAADAYTEFKNSLLITSKPKS